MRFRLEVSAPSLGPARMIVWGPAVTGEANQTGLPDLEASTFDEMDDAAMVLEVLAIGAPDGIQYRVRPVE